ncbi:hypothetical protein SAMN02910368_02019 [Lachnospiraceae bacterium G11]|nr:hypothetical protein SAMN02910368_02019 [Lachnospiraceae bacterium G11]
MKRKLLVLLLATAMIAGCGSNAAAPELATTETDDNKIGGEEDVSTSSEEVGSEEKEGAQAAEETDERDALFEKTYYNYTPEFGNPEYLCIIKNNSEETVRLTGVASAMDSAGNVLQDSKEEVEALAPGDSAALFFMFYDVKDASDISDVKYSYTYETPFYTPMVDNLKMELSPIDKGVIARVKNEGDIIGSYIEARAVFFDASGNAIYSSDEYVADINGEIRPGATIGVNLYCPDEYDHVECYLMGGYDGKAKPESTVEDSDFGVTEYMGVNHEMSETREVLVVKNNSEVLVGMEANFIAYDASGNMVDADTEHIDSLEPGDESVFFAYFSRDDIDSVEYFFSYDITPWYHTGLQNIAFSYEVNDNDVTATATNNNPDSVSNLVGYLLFFDAEGNLVNVIKDRFYTGVNFDAGETHSFMAIDMEFSSVKMYIGGGLSKRT